MYRSEQKIQIDIIVGEVVMALLNEGLTTKCHF